MDETKDCILDIPGRTNNLDSELGKFVEQMSKLVGFKPGMALSPYGSSGFPSIFSSFLYSNRLVFRRLVSQENLSEFEQLLKQHNVHYSKNESVYSLCCDEATAGWQNIKVYNDYNEMLLFITSPAKLSAITAVAYIPEFTQEDERLQRAETENWIGLTEKNPPSEWSTTLKLFQSVEEAQASIDEKIFSSLKRCVEERKGCNGAYLSDEKDRYRYPLDLTDETINNGNVTDLGKLKGEILKVYSDGVTLIDTQGTSTVPIEQYFDKNWGIERFQVGGCGKCCPGKSYKLLKERLKRETIGKIKADEHFELTGCIAKNIGYEFDPERIKIRVIKRTPVEVYQPNV